MTTEDVYECEDLLGKWVTARLIKRHLKHGPPPDAVCTWVTTAGNSPADENSEATPEVLGYVIKTIEDPDWPDPIPP